MKFPTTSNQLLELHTCTTLEDYVTAIAGRVTVKSLLATRREGDTVGWGNTRSSTDK
ncbi:MAG: hypothetical protein CLLPBCKN_004022 [Chroococcidiopsis cubana SAG 39.79]|uniref:hypothetical protein n=1 Tax=Chroococcidiopsis cubana TaxID=171392 RepID=UPI002AC599A8|nr:hypothetical protein [Chroococcidiopsis cubana]MDZ4874626.1 hypothetical protein [Chroococcidiopsis cubana SAG 39.79]